MRPDTGAPGSQSSRDTFQWKRNQLNYRDSNPLTLGSLGQFGIGTVSKPQQEQDVITLYHQLVGAGVIRGLKFLSTSSSERYDGLFVYEYPTSDYAFRDDNPLGVANSEIAPAESDPKVIEYKYNFDSLINDFEKEVKFHGDINLVVCWEIGDKWKEKYTFNSYIISDEGSNRQIYGATHACYISGHKMFDVLILEEFLFYLSDRATAEAQQRVKYVGR